MKYLIILIKIITFILMCIPILKITLYVELDIWAYLALFLYGFCLYYPIKELGNILKRKLI